MSIFTLPLFKSDSILTITRRDETLKLEKADVWDFEWAVDDANSFALMERGKLILYQNMAVDDQFPCSGYIVCLKNLQVQVALADDLLRDIENMGPQYFFTHQSKKYMELKTLLQAEDWINGSKLAEALSNSFVWKLLGDESLKSLQFDISKKAYAKCGEYAGIRFLKRVEGLDVLYIFPKLMYSQHINKGLRSSLTLETRMKRLRFIRKSTALILQLIYVLVWVTG
jgi:WD repeat-containing protein 35